MLKIILTSAAASQLRALLAKEGEAACVRLREFKIGTYGNKNMRIILGLSIDTREEDDVEGEAGSVPFVISRDLFDQYGRRFFISLDEQRLPVVMARR